MSEREASGERRLTFASPRDAALYVMSQEAWACESTGADDNVLGYTSWMANSAAELPEIVDAFGEEFERVGLRDHAQLIGNWLIDRSGIYVDVLSFDTEDAVTAAYRRVEALYDQMEDGA